MDVGWSKLVHCTVAGGYYLCHCFVVSVDALVRRIFWCTTTTSS